MRTFISAAAGVVVGAVLMLLAGSWTTTSAYERDALEARLEAAGYVTDSGRVVTAVRTAPVRRTVVVDAPVPRSTQTVVRAESAPKRSWKKTALVIGGSAGAGAGVGAIAGGKKGALIGAAIGGGAASIFEAIKRK